MEQQGERRRSIILAYVSVHPCCTLNAVAEATGLPLAMAKYHVERLEERKLLKVDKDKHWWCLYLPGTVMPDAPQARAIQDPQLWTLWTWMHTQERLLQQHILNQAQKLWNWSPATTRHRLKRLVQAGLLMRIPEGHAARHESATPRLQRRGDPMAA